jgi:hypothetical protein
MWVTSIVNLQMKMTISISNRPTTKIKASRGVGLGCVLAVDLPQAGQADEYISVW